MFLQQDSLKIGFRVTIDSSRSLGLNGFHVISSKVSCLTGHGGGLVVSVLAFYSDDPSLNPFGNLI